MCGIMGYVGDKNTAEILLHGLKKHEYRGYDSAGIAVLENNKIKEIKTTGKVEVLRKKIEELQFNGECGIGHTRWATHGGVTEYNAHPHVSTDRRVVLVHNGIIENAREIRTELEATGIEFNSETDSEAAVQYLAYVYTGTPVKAIKKLVKRIRGAFALVIMFADRSNEIWVVRKGSPLVVAHNGTDSFCASDPMALLEFTHDMYFLDDCEIAMLKSDVCEFFSFDGVKREKESVILDWDVSMTNKGQYPHYMLKEIHEQPEVIQHTLLSKLDNGSVDLSSVLEWDDETIQSFEKIHFVACGTSYYATIAAARIMETMCSIEIRTEVASEYRYRNIPINDKTLAVFVSQSGETADTLHAARLAKNKGATCLVITNVKDSTIHREVGHALITQAGPEIGVAATKTYTAQLASLTLLAMYIAKKRGELPMLVERRLVSAMADIPVKMQRMLGQEKAIERIARNFADVRGFFFIGRGLAYPSTLEGALKLKEISYLHAEAYPAGEMKHGPIALLDKDLPVIALVPKNILWEKTISNIEESMARKAPIIAIATDGDEEIEKYSENIIYIPETEPELYPFFASIPLQLFAYYVARQKGCDIDMPRNLAKSVTVE